MLLGEGDIYWMMIGLMITGFGGATSYVIPHSMKADVIDLDKLNSGEDRAASFFAVWSFITKISYWNFCNIAKDNNCFVFKKRRCLNFLNMSDRI